MVDAQRRRLLFGKLNQAEQPAVIRLPRVISEAVFIDQCTRCGDCIAACPENIIQQGDGGFPALSFLESGCSFCGECITACKQPLFLPQLDYSPNAQQRAWDWVAEIDDHCLALQAVFCQNCKDACDVQAIAFQYRQRGIPVPVIQAQACTGCGACVSPCPSSSIRMTAPSINKPKKNQSMSIEVTHEYGNSYQ